MAGEGAPGVIRDAQGRRLREVDRHGAPLAELEWTAGGALGAARLRLPDGSWLALEPEAATAAPGGRCDRLRHAGRIVGQFPALDWARPGHIPVLEEPARLPPGAGTTVLNLIAALAADQAVARLAYAGPYPTESLFLALLESFRHLGGAPDPLAAFMANRLAWTPAPHARSFEPPGACVQRRGRIEKVVWRGRAYYRADWQDVARHAPRRVHDAGGEVRCSLWALGAALEDHLVLGPAGDVRAAPEPPADPDAALALPPAVRDGLAAVVTAASAPALAAALAAVARQTRVEWGPVAADLVAAGATTLRFSHRLRALLDRRLAEAPTRAARVALGFAALAEMAHLAGDAWRARAQARLGAAPPREQAAALAREPAPPDARAIGAAVEALLAAQPMA